MSVAQLVSLQIASSPNIKRQCSGYFTTTRILIRSGCDLDEAYRDLWTGAMIDGWIDQIGCLWKDVPKRLLDWSSFLHELGLDATSKRIAGESISWILLQDYLLGGPENSKKQEEVANKIFLTCLLKPDLSLPFPPLGIPALQLLMTRKWSPELSPHFIDLAYILVHFGHAGVRSCYYNDFSPMLCACVNGWFKEWVTVLCKCEIDPHTVFWPDIEYYYGCKDEHYEIGESSAVDMGDLSLTEDLPTFENIRMRKHVVRAGLDED